MMLTLVKVFCFVFIFTQAWIFKVSRKMAQRYHWEQTYHDGGDWLLRVRLMCTSCCVHTCVSIHTLSTEVPPGIGLQHPTSDDKKKKTKQLDAETEWITCSYDQERRTIDPVPGSLLLDAETEWITCSYDQERPSTQFPVHYYCCIQ